MRILIVEDDPIQSDWLVSALRERWPQVELEVHSTESEFQQKFSKIKRSPPSAVIMDIMLRWGDPSPELTTNLSLEKGDFFRAGLRCLRSLLDCGETKGIPIVLWSVLDEVDLEGEIDNIPANVRFLSKSSSIDQLARVLGSFIAARGSMDELIAPIEREDRCLRSTTNRIDPEPSARNTKKSPAGIDMDSASPRVFISYSYDSDEHSSRVRVLSDRLRYDGIDSRIDQYVQAPAVGWPLWMDEEIREADFVLIIFTQRYLHRSRLPRKSGVRFESVLILQELYEIGMLNEKFIPVIFDPDDAEFIVKWLRPYGYFSVGSDQGYERLRRRLLNDPAIVMPPLRPPVRKGPVDL